MPAQTHLGWPPPGSSSIPRMETIPDIGAVALFPRGRPSDDLEPVIETIAWWSDSFSQRALPPWLMSGNWWELGPADPTGRRHTPRIPPSGIELGRGDDPRPKAALGSTTSYPT